jgi:thioesterase domain-containing protein
MLLRESGELPSLEELADAYVTAIRLQQPRGPYRVGGFSMGGLMAYEVAQRLLALGEDVENVLLLDTHLPERGIRRVRIHLQRASDWLSERAHCFVRRHFTRDASLAASAAELRMSRARGYRTAVLRYGSTMRRSRAPATLVVAVPVGATLEGTDLTRWRSLAPALRVEVIVGDHDTILTEPCVRSLAEICRGSLGCWQRAPVGQTT